MNLKQLLKIAKKHKIGIKYTEEIDIPCYFPETDIILYCFVEGLPINEWGWDTTQIIAHELIHASGHKERLNRKSVKCYRFMRFTEETIAILGSIILTKKGVEKVYYKWNELFSNLDNQIKAQKAVEYLLYGGRK